MVIIKIKEFIILIILWVIIIVIMSYYIKKIIPEDFKLKQASILKQG